MATFYPELYDMATQTVSEVIERRTTTPEDTREHPEEKDSSESSTGCCGRGRKGPKTRKPPSNKWLQQQIPACRPVFTAKHVFVLFLAVGIVFLILGIVFVTVTVRLRELTVDYTNCGPLESDGDYVTQFSSCERFLRNLSVLSNVARQNMSVGDCHCNLTFEVEETMRYPWKFYYALDNYYQNHRRYLNSWDPDQLQGEGFDDPDSNCRPLIEYRQQKGEPRRPIVPCGLIANSWFNDSFHYLRNDDGDVDLSRHNIAWDTDRDVRFRNPSNLERALEGTNMPPNWLRDLSGIGNETYDDVGLENESLIVWYRVSAFPWFRKLYGHPRGERDLPPGNYSLLITYNYPVDNFNGHKSIVISELSWLGGRNLFLGIMYIITAVVCIVTSVVLLVIHLFFSKWKTTNPNFLQREY